MIFDTAFLLSALELAEHDVHFRQKRCLQEISPSTIVIPENCGAYVLDKQGISWVCYDPEHQAIGQNRADGRVVIHTMTHG